jgi:hypothetical protein
MTVHRQQTRHQDLTIIRANEHLHHCSGGHFKIFPLYKVNTESDFLRRRKETLLINILKPGNRTKAPLGGFLSGGFCPRMTFVLG